MKVEDTLAQLVSIDSVSSRSNARIISYISQRLQAVGGVSTRRIVYKDDHGVEKVNLVATWGQESLENGVELALVGHTDTVPFDPAWKDALVLTAREGKLFGRGACDTKAFIASALTAIQSIDLATLRRPLALVFTSDEEVGCLGAKRLVEEKALCARYCIVGEPTSLEPMRAGKGYCLASVTVRGREGHSAYPALGASAILAAARLICKIERIGIELQSRDLRTDFDPPYTTLNIGLISGGTAKNVIAGECRFTLEWRPVPGQKPDYLLDLVQRAIDQEAKMAAEMKGSTQAGSCLEYGLVAERLDGGMSTEAGSRLVKLLEELTRRPAGTVSFGTEAPQMIELGAETVVFGPGDIRVAHQTNEFVPLDDLYTCVNILKSSIEHFCV